MNQLGFTHLCVRVDDVDEIAERVATHGGTVIRHTRTTFETDDGTAVLVDFMPVHPHAGPEVPTELVIRERLVRLLRCTRGSVGWSLTCRPRFEYGTFVPNLALVHDGMDIAIGRRGVRALEAFGHTSGGTVYLADGYVVTGDVLFVGGCGRTDLQPGGDTDKLFASLQRLLGLPEETRVYPGHNYGPTPTSTIGHEALTNPYLLCDSPAAFRALRERRR